MISRIQLWSALVVLASGCTMDFTAIEERDNFGCKVKADCVSGYDCINDTCVRQATGDPGAGDPGAGDPGAGDPGAGDPGAGDPGAGDTGAGDPTPGDPVVTVVTPSTEFCAAGGQMSSAGYHGFGCLSPVGTSGPTSTSSSHKLIPGPAHIVEVE